MNVVDALNAEYGEGAPRGRGPDQSRLQSEGNAYLAKEFPRMDFIKKATIEREAHRRSVLSVVRGIEWPSLKIH